SGDLEQKFDVIVMGDVLEHLATPQAVLRNVLPLLDSGGYIVVGLPNVVHWTQGLKIVFGRFRYQYTGLLEFPHLRFFDLRTARSLLIQCGFEIVKFQPLIGGRLSTKMRPLWQALANCLPNLFAYQFLFKARPREGRSSGTLKPDVSN